MNLYAIYQSLPRLSWVAHLRRNGSYLLQSKWLTLTGFTVFIPENKT